MKPLAEITASSTYKEDGSIERSVQIETTFHPKAIFNTKAELETFIKELIHIKNMTWPGKK